MIAIDSETDLCSSLQWATQLPLAFAQVREDALIDAKVIKRLARPASVAMIASGGCTAAYLAGIPGVKQLYLVDANPAQLALTRIKLHLLQTEGLEQRLQYLGHKACSTERRADWLSAVFTQLKLDWNCLGYFEQVVRLGPDYAGRYEQLFAILNLELQAYAPSVERLLQLDNTQQQISMTLQNTPFGEALDKAMARVMDLSVLTMLFGSEATKNRQQPFSQHFVQRLHHVLATLPARNNPYLWQMLGAGYPKSVYAPWMHLAITEILPDITFFQGYMAEALREKTGAFDMIHLSNILDWLSESEARSVLELAYQALRPGGYVLIRQLNSRLIIPELNQQFSWLESEAATWLSEDRSFFYRALHLGHKQ